MNNRYHVIKDPVHGTMQFTDTEDGWVKPFIDSPSFQRLRHIKQLGLGDFIFPGAVHTRFNHSLGCCYIASQIAQKIGLVDEERQLVMIACLLHDIGHGPFSHAFEGIFQQKAILHEDWTPHFLADYKSELFFKEYNRKNPRYHLSHEKFDVIKAMIMHESISKQVLADIVSSQLDADRLDYLLRDSHFCGVRYGEFDFPWMLHCMTIVEVNGKERLGITHKGIGVVEHYLMARRLMMRNIYHSQKKLAIEMQLVQLLAYLASHLQIDASFATLRETRLGEFLMAVNEFNQQTFSATSSSRKTEFIQTYAQHYKDLCDYDVFALIKQLAMLNADNTATAIARRLQARQMPKILRLNYEDLAAVQDEVKHFKYHHQNHFHDWQLTLIETPHRSYSGEADPIVVINEKKITQPISQFSLMLNAISDKLEHIAFLSIDKNIADDKRIAELIHHLQHKYEYS